MNYRPSKQTQASAAKLTDALAIIQNFGGKEPNESCITLQQLRDLFDEFYVTAAEEFPHLVPENNLSDVADSADARENLGLGDSAVADVGTTSGTVAAGDDPRIVGAALTADLGDAAFKNTGTVAGTVAAGDDSRIVGAAQTADLGDAAFKDTGTSAGTVAAGDDSRITGAAQKASNLSDLANAGTARTNLGLGGAAVLNVGTTAGTVAAGDDSRITGAAQKASNLSDLANAGTARTNLGLGGSAVLNVGTTAGTVAAGDDSRIVGAAQTSSLGGAAFLNVGTTAGTVAAGDDSRITGAAQKSANLSDLANVGTARTNLGLGGAAILNVGTIAGTVAAGDDSRITGAAQKANNLSDLANAGTARSNLGLGGAAVLNVGTTAGTVAAGDDSRITGAAQKSANLSDLANAGTARTNLGLGGAALLSVGTTAGTVAAGDDSRITGAAQKASNLSDLANAGTARTNLGLGGAAVLNVGTTAGTVAAGDDSRIVGAVQTSRTISTTAPLTGGGDLSANRTLAISDFVASGASHAKGAVPDPGVTAGTDKFLREDATWASVKQSIQGMEIVWTDATHISVGTGEFLLESGGMIYNPSAIAVTGSGLSNSTWYHVYINGSLTASLSTTAPATAFFGTARSKTGDTSNRYLFSIKTDASGNIMPFQHDNISGHVHWRTPSQASPFRVLSGGVATTKTSVDCSAVIPVTSQTVIFLATSLDASATRTAFWGNDSDNTSATVFFGTIGPGRQLGPWICPLSPAQKLNYLFNGVPTGGGAGLYLDVQGFHLKR